MAVNWEYKVITLKHGGGGLKLTVTPDDDEAIASLNREGANGWELVSAVCTYPGQPMMFYLKRPR
ncbi:DUF4177 domain-containing protein [Rhodanobacter sp. L36]|uniref:DUF4177 domain-containing protein n=1 Tax=Rhodanobacter sp. L36 TaxID=1747221 RepID=UPI00131CE0E5|nr:DUF4177 domain-containing protein [Rhodanobacter sp. L36]